MPQSDALQRLIQLAEEEWDEQPSGEALLCGKSAVLDFLHMDEVRSALSESGDAARNAALEEAAYLVSVEAAVPKLTTNEMHARLQQIAGHIRDMKRRTGNNGSET